ncbi:MAG: hypothetical protein HYX73_01090, partial [Acidobacteria bacterium]|nr:hypothetical protein [Acidobacteriota bacterium]
LVIARKNTQYFTLSEKDEILESLGLEQARNPAGSVLQDKFVDRESGAAWGEWPSAEAPPERGISKREFLEAVKELGQSKSLDERSDVLRRTEQGFLRQWLFGRKKESDCKLCGRVMPVDLLVAAHVKKRASCTIEEKRDYARNVMALCKLGCDDLFERGYIIVVKGVVAAGQNMSLTSAVSDYINSVEGRICEHWNAETADYFKWHRQQWEPT